MKNFEPRQLSKLQSLAWQKLVASRRYLQVSALGKKWKFQFVLTEHSLTSNSIAVGIRLGNHFGTLQCSLLNGRWLSELLQGPGIETIQEPFRTAIVGVFLEDFFYALSESSHLTLRLVENPPATEQQVIVLYWQMVNDQGEAEIVGRLIAGEQFVSEICNAASRWPFSHWKFPDSIQISVDVLIGSLSLSQKECTSLEVGDTLLLGNIEAWRQENLFIRINQAKEDSLIPINFTRSTLEKTILKKNLSLRKTMQIEQKKLQQPEN